MTKSNIGWIRADNGAQGETWNPIRAERGTWHCVKVCVECLWCYSERMNVHRGGPAYVAGRDTLRLDDDVLHQPNGWARPRRIFVCSMTDLFQDAVPEAWIRSVVDIIEYGPQHQWILLTKRPARAREMLTRWQANGWKPTGALILGTSAGTRKTLEALAPEILATPGPIVRMLSASPLLEAIDVRPYLVPTDTRAAFDWVVGEGESGGTPERALVERCACDGRGWLPDHEHKGARIDCQCVRFQRGWMPTARGLALARSLRDQCIECDTPFFWKGWGGPTARSAGRVLDGVAWDQFPPKLGGAR